MPQTLAQRLTCDTCDCETTVAVGNMDPYIIETFMRRHFPPHHNVVVESMLEAREEDA